MEGRGAGKEGRTVPFKVLGGGAAPGFVYAGVGLEDGAAGAADYGAGFGMVVSG